MQPLTFRKPCAALLLCSVFLVSACAPPYEELETGSDVFLDGREAAALAPPEAAENPFEPLWRDGAEVSETPEVETLVVAADPPEPRERTSVIGWLTRLAPRPGAPAEADESARIEEDQAPVREASLSPAPSRSGLFSNGPRRAPAKGISRDMPYGSVLPFGTIARVCEARSKPLGQKIAVSEGRGQAYSLYDSAPGATGPRSFYITGFADRCPRQFTAALALFGAPSMHEKLRYGRPADIHPYSETDKAYEEVKRRVCKVQNARPCGARIELLERDTVFVSTYERFTDNGRWADLLIHDGAVLAKAIKQP